jgi:hypothetical protein
MGWVVLLPTAAVWFVVSKGGRLRRGAAAVSVAVMLLAAIAGCGFAYTFAGRWFAELVAWIGRILANITGEAGIASGIAVALTLLLMLTAVADIACDRRADRAAQVSAFLMPVALALVAGGSLGASGGTAVESVTSQVSAFMSQIGGA